MTRRFALVLVILAVSVLLTACSTESRDVAEEYMNAVLQGDEEKALELACESFADSTTALMTHYPVEDVQIDSILTDSIDLKYDMGKGNNENEIIVTGAFQYGDETRPQELELSEKHGTRIVLSMQKEDGDWCVAEDSVFGSGETAEEED